MFTVGIIGSGWWAQEYVNSVQRLKSVKIKGCFSETPDNASRFCKFNAIDHYTSCKELIESRPDLVLIAVPNGFYRQLASECLVAGLHVYIDKPGGQTAGHLLALKKQQQKSTARLFVGYNKRFHPLFNKILFFSKTNKVSSIDIFFGADAYLGADSWRSDPVHCSLGAFTQLGVHGLDFVHAIVGTLDVDVASFDATLDENSVVVGADLLGKVGCVDIRVGVRYNSDENRMSLRINGDEVIYEDDMEEVSLIRSNDVQRGRSSGSLKLALESVINACRFSLSIPDLGVDRAIEIMLFHDSLRLWL